MDTDDLLLTVTTNNQPTAILFTTASSLYTSHPLHIETDEVYYASLEEENKLREWLNKRHQEREGKH